jgi:hypothetical protein
MDCPNPDHMGSSGHCKRVCALRPSALSPAFPTRAGGGRLFSWHRSVPDVLVSPAGAGTSHCLVLDPKSGF